LDTFREQLGRRRIRSAFAQYLSPTLVEQLVNAPHQLVLGGEERIITVLFSDVRGFTTIAETYKDNPHGLTNIDESFFDPLTNAIMARNGNIENTWEMRSCVLERAARQMPPTKATLVMPPWTCSERWTRQPEREREAQVPDPLSADPNRIGIQYRALHRSATWDPICRFQYR